MNILYKKTSAWPSFLLEASSRFRNNFGRLADAQTMCPDSPLNKLVNDDCISFWAGLMILKAYFFLSISPRTKQ